MLSVLVAIGFTLLLSKTSRRQIIKTFLWSLSIGVALESLYPYGGPGLGLWEALFGRSDFSSINALSSGRLTLWQLAIENIVSHPFLGHGMESFEEYVSTQLGTRSKQVHNGYLEYLHAGGIFAALSIFGIVAFYYTKLCLYIRHTSDWTLLAVFTALTATFAFAFLDGILFYYRPLLHTVLFFAIANYRMK